MVVSRSLMVCCMMIKMGDALGNQKYVTYIKKGAFAQPKNTQM